jgi:hypothetical protein
MDLTNNGGDWTLHLQHQPTEIAKIAGERLESKSLAAA